MALDYRKLTADWRKLARVYEAGHISIDSTANLDGLFARLIARHHSPARIKDVVMAFHLVFSFIVYRAETIQPTMCIVNTLEVTNSEWYTQRMADLIIPLLNIPRQRLTTVVGGQEIQLAVWRQPNDGNWYASVEFPIGTNFISGKRILLNSPLLTGYYKGDFTGDLVCRGIGDVRSEPGEEPWGTTHTFRFEPEE